jgi:hypothetical protein
MAPADILESLDRANDGRAIQQLHNHLVRELRTWRPDVVVTHHDQSELSQPLAALIQQMVMKAVQSAADAAQQPALRSELGLEPWQVKKVYGVLSPGTRGSEVVATGRFSPSLGTTLSDFTSPARDLLGGEDAPPDTYELELLASRVDEPGTSRGLLGGIALASGSEARRPQTTLPGDNLNELRRLASKRRHLAALLERDAGSPAWAAQVAQLTSDLDADHGARLLLQLAEGYRATGRLDLAADTFFLLARRYPDHPLVDGGLAWLVQYYASGEMAHQSAARGLTSVRQAAYDESNQTAPAIALSRDDRLRRAIQMTEYLKSARPALYAEPAVRFAEVAAQRQLGFANPAKRYFLTLRNLPESDPWRALAETELWLGQPADLPPPKTLAACRRTTERPHLDGKLDEPFWRTAERLRLRDDDVGRTIVSVQHGETTDKIARRTDDGEVRLACDGEYLYLAIRCPQAPGGDYRADDRPRPRDAVLTRHDRVTLQLDVDRDFSTAYELSVDARGWTHDACWGDANWNPTWYVAASRDASTWTVEAAIPLTELVAKPPVARDVWAVALRRTIPRVGYQTWSGSASGNQSPDQFSLVIFE